MAPRINPTRAPVPTQGHPLVIQLRRLIAKHDVAVTWVAQRAGLSKPVIFAWSHSHSPSVVSLEAALGVLGYELAVVNSKTGEIVGPRVTQPQAVRGSR